MTEPAISARGITMRFGDAEVLSRVDVEIGQGSIHALIGENGAGKSTLGKVIGGYHQATSGTLNVFGQSVGRWDPPAALDRGVAMMHQELQLVPYLTVAQNVFMGIEDQRWGILRQNEAHRLHALMAKSGLHLDPHAVTASLPIADQQKIEILRALAREARVIVMDEPTSSLSKDEIDNLHRIMRELKNEGRSIIYVTHFLDHVLEVCDQVTVLRDGQLVKSGPITDETKHSLVSAMLGEHKSETLYPKKHRSTSERVVLRVRELKNTSVAVDAIDIREGEILGLIGLVGSGRSEIARAIVGADPAEGEVLLDGVPVPRSVRATAEAGMVLVPEDRRAQGLVMTMPVRANITLPRLPAYSSGGIVLTGREREAARALIDRFSVRPAMIDGDVSHYSGGNQQKVLLAKWLDGDPKLVILDEPSRGVDVGARETIHAAIADLAKVGTAILLISSEIEEVLGLAHRALIVDRGRIVQDIDPETHDEAEVLAALFRHQSIEEIHP